MAFRTARSTFGIPRNYRHIWDTLQGLSILQGHVAHLNEGFLNEEHSRHRFISCLVTKMVWKFINAIWMSLTRVIQSPFKWVFAQGELGGLSHSFQIILDYLRYYGLWFIWHMRNAFIFDEQRGVQCYVLRLKIAIFVVEDVKHIQS